MSLDFEIDLDMEPIDRDNLTDMQVVMLLKGWHANVTDRLELVSRPETKLVLKSSQGDHDLTRVEQIAFKEGVQYALRLIGTEFPVDVIHD